jgi:hypothetical protein
VAIQRITEAGDVRITQISNIRVTEDSVIVVFDSQQGLRHASFNALHGGAMRTYNGDVVAGCLADEAGITATTFNGVLGQWLGLKGYTNDTLNGRMNAFAIANNAESWSALGTFTV